MAHPSTSENLLARTAVHWAEYRINRQAGLSRDGDLSEIARNALEFLTMTECSFVHIKTDVQDVLLHWDVFGAEGPPEIEIFTRRLVQQQPEADKSSFIAENAYTATKVRLHRKLREIITGEEVISNATSYIKY
ncbi:uncharacterized protein PV06_08074 [Exophiala oligosperma]|uniref:Uncharacterized protein n=1 Tax=Exophiala oligosperma TaxID=215243 RepID=A0A0D2D8N4_9EURO|nr:uncharacterized protein PV06_08074 [Exophiala oligosperma]KIW39463.1 hypothetical protein PV06_08074 [Exophiala oligosperma]